MEYDYDPEGPYGPFDNITIDYDDYDEIGHTEILSGINSGKMPLNPGLVMTFVPQEIWTTLPIPGNR